MKAMVSWRAFVLGFICIIILTGGEAYAQSNAVEQWVIRELQQNGSVWLDKCTLPGKPVISAAFVEQLLCNRTSWTLPPVVSVYNAVINGDLELNGRSISQHLYLCGVTFTNKVHFRHVDTTFSLEICHSAFESTVVLEQSDFESTILFDKCTFSQGLTLRDCSIGGFLRINGNPDGPSTPITFESLSVGKAIEVREGKFASLTMKRVDCNTLTIRNLESAQISLSEIGVAKALDIVKITIGSENMDSLNAVASSFTDISVGTSTRITDDRFFTECEFHNITAQSFLLFDRSRFLEKNKPVAFKYLWCNADLSFAETRFNSAPTIQYVYVANQLTFTEAVVNGDTLDIASSSINGRTSLKLLSYPTCISLRECAFGMLAFPDPSNTKHLTYKVETTGFKSVTVDGQDRERWVKLAEQTQYAEPFCSSLQNDLADNGQDKEADRLRIPMMRHKAGNLTGFEAARDKANDFFLAYGTQPWTGFFVIPIVTFLGGVWIYRRSEMVYSPEESNGPSGPYYSFVYTASKLVPFFWLQELEGWKPKGMMGWTFLLTFPIVQLMLGVLAAHYAFDRL